MSDSNATELLCKMLDERGVEYQKLNEYVTWVFLEDRAITFFSNEHGVSAEVSYPRPVLNGTEFLTPEQAIAATLADDAYDAVANEHVITAEQLHALLDEWDKHPGRAATDGEMMTYATLGGGECEWELEHSGTLYDKWRCSECKFLFVEPRCDQGYTDLVPNYCPNCGKAVKR